MAFIDLRLPVKISLGSGSGVIFKTDIVVYGNGQEYVNKRWPFQRSSFDLSYVVKNRADANEVYKFFLNAQGRFNTFRVKDNLDYTSNSDGTTSPSTTDQVIGTGDGTTTQFQLIKSYSNGVTTYPRNITKPVSGSVLAALNGSTTTAFTVDTDTGIITFTSPPGSGVEITAGYEFDLHCRFDQDEIENIEYILLRQDSSKDRFNFPPLRVVEVL